MFVASEGNDRISLVRFGPDRRAGGAGAEDRLNPTELAGPHGLYVSPDEQWYYVTTAHGTPNGALWKFSTATDEQAGRLSSSDSFPPPCRSRPTGTTPGW